MNARLQDKRTWLVGGAAVAVVVSAASWFFVLDPVVSDTDSIRSQTAGVKQQNRDAQDKITQLANTQTQLGALQHDLTVKLSALPMANGLPDFTRQLNRQASDLGLTVTSIPSPSPVR